MAKCPSKTISIVTIPLKVEKWQADDLDKRLNMCQNLYNSLLSKKLKVLRAIERSDEFKAALEEIRRVYLIDNEKERDKQKKGDSFKKAADTKNRLLMEAGFTEYDIKADAVNEAKYFNENISSMRNASKHGESGFIWHTTGSGKTMTSYKSTRNLLMDTPSIEKTIFLIDRKDLDLQTKMAFQSYADNDTIDVDDTENVGNLIKKLTDGNRQMIVTTRQKMQIMINRRLEKGGKQYEKTIE